MTHKIREVYIVHHSHTDVGYTDLQEQVIYNQANNIRRAVELIENGIKNNTNQKDLKAFVKGVRGYFSYYLRRFSLCFCLNNAFQPVLRSQTATMVKKHFDFIICFALLNHKNSIRFVFLRMVIWGG